MIRFFLFCFFGFSYQKFLSCVLFLILYHISAPIWWYVKCYVPCSFSPNHMAFKKEKLRNKTSSLLYIWCHSSFTERLYESGNKVILHKQHHLHIYCSHINVMSTFELDFWHWACNFIDSEYQNTWKNDDILHHTRQHCLLLTTLT